MAFIPVDDTSHIKGSSTELEKIPCESPRQSLENSKSRSREKILHQASIHHCELLPDCAHHGTQVNYMKCKTHPGHHKFLTVEEFGMEHLPSKYQTEEYMGRIHNVIDRTVKITVSSTSRSRPDSFPDSSIAYPFSDYKGSNIFSRCGTGFVECIVHSSKEHPCPCPECKKSDHPKIEYWKFIVSTATHVVFDQIEAKSAVIELFYDSENRGEVKNLYGNGVLGNELGRYRTDVCGVICITHEQDLASKLRQLCQYKVPNECNTFEFGVLVSHPHGVSKKISVGNIHKHHHIKDQIDLPVKLKKGDQFYISFCKLKQDATKQCQSKLATDNILFNSAGLQKQIVSFSQCEEFPEMERAILRLRAQEKTFLPSQNSSLNEFQSSLISGDLFTLPLDMTIVSPLESKSRLYREISVDPKFWYSFPAEMESIGEEGRTVCVPLETKCLMSGLDLFNTANDSWYVTYNMAACPGCSGARVVDGTYPYSVSCHFGFSRGESRSGLTRVNNCLSVMI